MIRILKASAGSGKTFRLAYEYIRLLFTSGDPYAYRHILAVTFTNKATDEMKTRILSELFILSEDTPSSKYLPLLVRDGACKGEDDARDKAGRYLASILHDYSAFSVSTIDRFFQQTLKSFAHEIGQFASYRVELDREMLVNESVDRILDSLTEKDRGMLDWLTENVMESLRDGKKYRLEGSLRDMAINIKSESFRTVAEEGHVDVSKVYTPENLRLIRKETDRIRKEYSKDVREKAEAVLGIIRSAGLEPEDFKGKRMAQIVNFTKLGENDAVPSPTPAFFNYEDPGERFTKANATLSQNLEGTGFEERFSEFLDLFKGIRRKEYNTLGLIRKGLYDLGIAGRLMEAFAEIQKEKNVISIDETNVLLRKIIDGTDAPFVYEKTGTRYDHFLLDEFQDTSRIQWDNFRPLVENSVALGQDNLVVGDVKQSIYRWRDSDWHLLSGLEHSFDGESVKVETLRSNRRTLRNIVEFNSALFPELSRMLDEGLDSSHEKISDLYSDASQEVAVDKSAGGSVTLSFCPDVEHELDEILKSIREYMDAGGRYGEIAIVLRKKKHFGPMTARMLMENGIPVISDDSLDIRSSVTVRRLISLLSLVGKKREEGERARVSSFLALSLGVDIPDSYHSIVDLSEQLLSEIRAADPERFDAETVYIQSFMDYLSDWTSSEGNSLEAFLRDWPEAKVEVSSPDEKDSVRLITAHKSKGLEFPFVIFPFAETVTLFRSEDAWCLPEGKTLPETVRSAAYRVTLSSKSSDTLFAGAYRRELNFDYIDNLNLFYVAMTRPKYNLRVIAADHRYDNMARRLRSYVGSAAVPEWNCGEEEDPVKRYRIGELYIPEPPSGEGQGKISLSYTSYPAGAASRLRLSRDAKEFFNADGEVGVDASRRLRGIVLHGILSRVKVPSDLHAAVSAAVQSGEIAPSEAAGTESFLSEKISSVLSRGWFPEDGKGVFREIGILDTDGEERRPDRVIVRDGAVRIVDYKFGVPKRAYHDQVAAYAALFRKMGYRDVRTTLWYINENGEDFFEED